jgi:glucose-6-phosphate-specific signal transduction histidine kinase
VFGLVLRSVVRFDHLPGSGGLRQALEMLARRSAVPVRLDVGVERRLTEPVELAAYYAVAEALTNIAKHADASVVNRAGGNERRSCAARCAQRRAWRRRSHRRRLGSCRAH